jgi:hypothetical protein
MWRGVTRAKPFLTGASMVRIGWLKPAKVLVYPIRNAIDAQGRQLINWVVDIETRQYKSQRDWNRQGRLEDFPRCATGTPTGSTSRRCSRHGHDPGVPDGRPGSARALTFGRPRCSASGAPMYLRRERRRTVDLDCRRLPTASR